MQGGLIFGLTAALYGEITIEKGRVQQSNFNDYRMLRIDQAPAIEVHLIKSGEAPGGIGETGTTAGAAGAAQRDLSRRPGSRCGACRSIAKCWRGGNRHERLVQAQPCVALRPDRRCGGVALRLVGLSGSCSARARWHFAGGDTRRACRLSRGRPDRRARRTRERGSRSRAANIWRAPPTARPATRPRAARRSPAGSPSCCRSARSIRPTSRRTRKPASAAGAMRISSTPCTRASRRRRRGSIRRCPMHPTRCMTDADALAIKAYLFSLAPVHAPAPANTLAFPFNQRWLMAFWSLLFNSGQAIRAAHRRRAPQWNRGAYLVEALAHCGECHTPRNLHAGAGQPQQICRRSRRPAGAPTTSPATRTAASAVE